MTVLDTGVPTPANATELAEILGTPDKAKHVLKDTTTLGAFIEAYAQKTQGDGTDLARQVQAEVQLGLQAFLKEHQDGKDAAEQVKRLNLAPGSGVQMLQSHKQATAHNPKAIGAALDNEFTSAADYFYTAWHKNPSQAARDRMAKIRDAYSSVVPADGGFLVPEVLRSQLLALALELSVVRPRATVVPMDSARVPFPMVDTTTNSGSVYGGMIGYWGEESAALTASEAKFGRITLDAKKLTGYALVPNELLQDSIISFAALIESLWPKALAFFEDVAFLTGSGVGEPLGLIGASNPAGIAVSAEGGQTAATVVLENVINMYSRMLPSSLNSAVWLVAPDVLPQLLTMSLSVGTGGAPVMLVNAAGPAPQNIFGRPIVITEKAKTLGTRGDIVFADLSYYLVGDRQQMTAASSEHIGFQNDQTAYRIIQRVDGRPWIQSAVTPQNGSSSTLSPFVEIAAR